MNDIDRLRYPDGQIYVKVNKFTQNISQRILSYEDLFFLKAVSDCYKHNNIALPNLFIPCMFAQLSDRRFNKFEDFHLKIVIDFINSCDFESVSVLDPHSDVTAALLDRCKVIKPDEYILKTLDIIKNEVVLVSPDAGAYKKVFNLANTYKLELVAANKVRDRDGNISMNFTGDVKGKECLIVDDICLGGRTFIELAKSLKEQGAKENFLYVSHGHFFNGFQELSKNISWIFCTNSVKDINNDFVTQYRIV